MPWHPTHLPPTEPPAPISHRHDGVWLGPPKCYIDEDAISQHERICRLAQGGAVFRAQTAPGHFPGVAGPPIRGQRHVAHGSDLRHPTEQPGALKTAGKRPKFRPGRAFKNLPARQSHQTFNLAGPKPNDPQKLLREILRPGAAGRLQLLATLAHHSCFYTLKLKFPKNVRAHHAGPSAPPDLPALPSQLEGNNMLL